MRKRRRRHEEHENHERWLVSYADFITLLFAFFVVMYATSNSDTEKQKEFEESIKASLRIAVIGSGMGGGGQGVSIDPRGSMLPNLMNPIEDFRRRGGPADVQEMLERQAKRYFSQEEMDRPVFRIVRDPWGARIVIEEAMLFSADDVRLKKSAVDFLEKLGSVLKQVDGRIVFEGRGEAKAWGVSGERATNLANYFVKRRIVTPAQVSAVAFAGDGDGIRRLEILVTAESAE